MRVGDEGDRTRDYSETVLELRGKVDEATRGLEEQTVCVRGLENTVLEVRRESVGHISPLLILFLEMNNSRRNTRRPSARRSRRSARYPRCGGRYSVVGTEKSRPTGRRGGGAKEGTGREGQAGGRVTRKAGHGRKGDGDVEGDSGTPIRRTRKTAVPF